MTRSLHLTLLLALVASTAALGQPLVWPEPPAEPVVRFQSVVRKLVDFEAAIQGPTESSRRIQKLKRPSGVAFDARGRLMVSDARQSALLMIDADLGVVLVYGTGTTPSLRDPRGVAVADDGTIFVADAALPGAIAFDPSGEVDGVYGGGQLQEPTDVALSPDGSRLYITDARAHNVAIFDVASKRPIETFGSRGNGVAEFQAPTAIEFDARGRMLIVDQLNSRVQIFDERGSFTRALQNTGSGALDRPADVAVDDSGRIYVTDAVRSEVAVYDATMKPLMTLGRNGLRNGEFLGIGSVATAGERLVVLDRAGGRIQLFELVGMEPAASQPVPEPPVTEPPIDTRAEVAPAERPAPPASEPTEPPQVTESEPPIEATDLEEAPRVDAETAEVVPSPEGSESPAEEALDEALAAVDQVSEEAELIAEVQEWAGAWAAQDADAYLGFYASTFVPPDDLSLEDWSELRRQRVSAPDSIEIALERIEVESMDTNRADVTFVQSYTSDRFSDRVLKRLQLVREDGGWRIERESVLEALSSP